MPLRNNLHRRNHKERGQLKHREKLGFLEKHKDYVQRARDYHSKQDRLTRLRQKAADRNKDEFYFSMNKEKTRGGVHLKDRGNTSLPVDFVKVLKTQDENYVRTMRASNVKKMDQLKAKLMSQLDLLHPGADEDDELDNSELETLRSAGILPQTTGKKGKGRSKSRHLVFVDSAEEARKLATAESKPAAPANDKMDVDSDEPDLGWKTESSKQKRRKSLPIATAEDEADWYDEETNEGSTERTRILKELSARLIRDRQLRYAQREFEMQRLLMGKGGRTKLRGAERLEASDDEASDDEDALDARGGRQLKSKTTTEKAYKPRIYKWRLERKA
ncbi:u3 small nucleolar RNA-associated protein 11 [Schizophyllum amplum]|uniref:U3 small nucleolar RNA-associated protein 11 n=1 Tax=Schizophyllum amplum TaxID=97359 RepID=A0A550CMC0_9AGAR|nr:u3 small nucleolar RNA-associated protein 11 [Auriculariopsis ampla]